MANDNFDLIGTIIFGILLLSMFVETVLAWTWNRWYFTSGLAIFVKRIPVGPRHINIPISARFETQFRSTWTRSLVFKEVKPYTYAFGENCLEFRILQYSPLMRGMLFFAYPNNQVVVKGFADWSVLDFSIIWLSGVVLGGVMGFPETTWIALAFLTFFSLLMGIMYGIQYDRYSQAATFAAQEWERRYLLNIGGA